MTHEQLPNPEFATPDELRTLYFAVEELVMSKEDVEPIGPTTFLGLRQGVPVMAEQPLYILPEITGMQMLAHDQEASSTLGIMAADAVTIGFAADCYVAGAASRPERLTSQATVQIANPATNSDRMFSVDYDASRVDADSNALTEQSIWGMKSVADNIGAEDIHDAHPAEDELQADLLGRKVTQDDVTELLMAAFISKGTGIFDREIEADDEDTKITRDEVKALRSIVDLARRHNMPPDPESSAPPVK
jgi:hypothetical protein